MIFIYIFLLLAISWWAGRKADANSFFTANRNSRWYVVALGMVSASISGISVVSVPGMVRGAGFTYMQMVLGFILGYVVVAYLLLPLYYKLSLTTIYSYLGQRFGSVTHKTGALFFFVYKLVAAASKLYLVLIVLHFFVLDSLQVPFALSAFLAVAFVFVYTFRSGIKTLVWTDAFQTVCLVLCVSLIFFAAVSSLDVSFSQACHLISSNDWSRMFVMDDFYSRQNFFKQFLSGMFIVVVMTGLDQDVMQKNLTCKNYHEAKKNMLTYGCLFVPVNLLLLALGCVLLLLAESKGLSLPERSDYILPFFVMDFFADGSVFAGLVSSCFVIALLSAAFSSADSAMVSLTTSLAVDVLRFNTETLTRGKRILLHSAICMAFFLAVLLFRFINSQNALDAIYTIVSYLNGPLLGLFAFGLFTRFIVHDKWVPFVGVLSPVLCAVLSYFAEVCWNYKFGYELLLLNGLLTFLGLWIIRKRKG
ncbi:MAG: sodium:solute symporter [Bacteroidales bacterium]|nr:sodium:solute symporter [Candidatus Physcocola equi]